LSATQRLLRFGLFELNLDTEELRKDGLPLKLPPQPFRILVLLAEHAGQVVTREEIRQQVWGNETYVDFEHGLNQCIKQIRTALADNTDSPMYVETLPRRGYRFVAPVTSKNIPAPPPRVTESQSGIHDGKVVLATGAPISTALAASAAGVAPAKIELAPTPPTPGTPVSDAPASEGGRRLKRAPIVGSTVFALALVVIGFYWYSQKGSALTEKDTVVLADFSNTTGDPVFDGPLRQGLSSQLEQSPYLNLLSDMQIARTLALMAQAKDARLTHELARDVCERTASTAIIEGSIDKLGNQYVLGLRAVNCRDGDVLGEEQASANSKEQVMGALGKAATNLRKKLGESLASVQKYDAPAEKVTTSSIEALQAYDLGYKAQVIKSDFPAAISFFERAVSLDPNFAMAYARLATCYLNSGETTRATENIGKAYELRDRASEREKFYISGRYKMLSGDLEGARKTYQLWAQTYARDPSPRAGLYVIDARLGNYDEALNAMQEALKLNSASALYYGDLISGYAYLDRLDDAKATARQAREHNIKSPIVGQSLYMVDFMANDPAGMKKEVAAAAGKPPFEDVMLQFESDTLAYTGQFAKARELTRRASESALRADGKERAAGYAAESAIREALAGNLQSARHNAQAALALAKVKDAEGIAAIALALSGDAPRAMKLAADLAEHFPQDTVIQFDYLPMIHASLALGNRDMSKGAAGAIEALRVTSPYELGNTSETITFALYPVYLRGQAYLAGQQGAEAAAQFRKILDRPGIVQNETLGSLAHLGLARALVLSGDRVKAKAAYQDFLALWKDADPDIPILGQAKAEYAKLM